MTPVVDRRLQRLALAGALVVLIGSSLGLDGAVAVAFSLAVMELDPTCPERSCPMLLPLTRPEPCLARGANNGPGQGLGSMPATLRRSYRGAVRLAAREEILADLAGDAVIARLHTDTARADHRGAAPGHGGRRSQHRREGGMSRPAAVTLTPSAEEVSALREPLDVGGWRHVLDELSGLFVSWERKGRG